jgi:hypothetical protein
MVPVPVHTGPRSRAAVRLLFVLAGLAMLLTGCTVGLGKGDIGPNPGGGFYSGRNLNVGRVNP